MGNITKLMQLQQSRQNVTQSDDDLRQKMQSVFTRQVASDRTEGYLPPATQEASNPAT